MIKPLAIGILSLVSLISLNMNTAPVKAQTVDTAATQEFAVNTIPPQKLIKLARQGRFKTQGIPSYSKLNSAIRSGKVNAQTLVSAAIKQNRLPKAALQDVGYLSAIKDHLQSGGCGSL